MIYKTIFFDLDNTIIDTIENTKQVVEEIYYKYGLSNYFNSYSHFYDIYRENNKLMWEKYAQGKITKGELNEARFTNLFSNISDITVEQSKIMNADYLSCIVNRKKLVEGAIQLLDYLQTKKYPMHIISNGFTELQYKKMQSASITHYFDKIILSDAVGANKPSPEIFEYALKQSGVAAKESIMIGDDFTSDISGAYSCGISQIWYNPDNISSQGFTPTYTVDSLSAIINIL